MKQVSKYNFGIFFPYHVYNAVVGTAEVYKDKIDPWVPALKKFNLGGSLKSSSYFL